MFTLQQIRNWLNNLRYMLTYIIHVEFFSFLIVRFYDTYTQKQVFYQGLNVDIYVDVVSW